MSFADGKVLLCRLYERTSVKGHRYLAGRPGTAKLVAFLDSQAELQFGATACFNVFLQSGKERKQGGAGDQGKPHRHPINNGASSRAGHMQHWPLRDEHTKYQDPREESERDG